MSHTTVKAIYPNEKHENVSELSNAWGSAPYVWDNMVRKYLPNHEGWFYGKLDDLWPLWSDKKIPLHHRAVLMMTYDRAYIAKKDYTRAANDIRRFLVDFP